MKINIITCAFSCLPPIGIGAVEKLWYDLALEFAKKGHDVVFYAKQEKSSPKSPFSEVDNLQIVYLRGYRRPKSMILDTVLDCEYSFRALIKMAKCDILVCNTKISPLLAEFFRYKFICSVYNVARVPKGQFGLLLKVDRLASCSTMITNEVLKQTPKCIHNIKTINNPVNLKAFTFKQKKINKENVKIIFTGRIHPEKGLLNLAKAVSMLVDEYPNIKLVLVGTYEIKKGGGGISYVEEIKRNLGTTNLIIEEALASPFELAKKIQNADIYCYPPIPTTGDAMPCAPLEAMATGTPIIVSDLPCFDDYVDEENGVRFNLHSNVVENLKNALKLLIEDDDFREKIALNGMKRAKSFSNEKIANSYLTDFKELLAKKNR